MTRSAVQFRPQAQKNNKKIMAKKKRPFIKIQCKECKEINYFTKKSKGMDEEKKKLDLSKFCNSCRKHTPHKEARK
jgi:large subunit ribosomal protein L33